jgi:hypothetical protein
VVIERILLVEDHSHEGMFTKLRTCCGLKRVAKCKGTRNEAGQRRVSYSRFLESALVGDALEVATGDLGAMLSTGSGTPSSTWTPRVVGLVTTDSDLIVGRIGRTMVRGAVFMEGALEKLDLINGQTWMNKTYAAL